MNICPFCSHNNLDDSYICCNCDKYIDPTHPYYGEHKSINDNISNHSADNIPQNVPEPTEVYPITMDGPRLIRNKSGYLGITNNHIFISTESFLSKPKSWFRVPISNVTDISFDTRYITVLDNDGKKFIIEFQNIGDVDRAFAKLKASYRSGINKSDVSTGVIQSPDSLKHIPDSEEERRGLIIKHSIINIKYGLIIIGIGILLSIIISSQGKYYLVWIPVVIGGQKLYRGIIGWLKYRR